MDTYNPFTSPHNSVGRALELKSRGCGFDSRAGSIPGLVNLTVINCLSDKTLNRGPA